MKWILMILVFVVGFLQPMQAGMNAELRRFLKHPLQSAATNMVIGAVAVILVMLLVGVRPPSFPAIASAPRWSLGGGLIGGALVTTMLIAAPKLGALLLVACFLTGQLTSSVTLDHFGIVGYEQRGASLARLGGLVLLVAGVILIERASR